MKQDSQTEVLARVGQARDPHRSLHSETGARPGEHPGRSGNPLVKVAGLAWLEFDKPDLDRAERFGTDFGFTVADRTPDTLLLRGRQAAAACLVIRRGPQARFVGPAFAAAARDDLDRLARGTGGTVTAHRGGHTVLLRDPSGVPVRVVHGVPEFPALTERAPLPLNFGSEPVRVNATQRPAQQQAEIQRLGHVVLGTTRFRAALDWYLDTLGLIVSATSCTWTASATAARRWRSSAATWAASPPTITPWPWRCSRTPATCTRPTRSPTWMRWPPAGSTCASAATGTRGAWAGTFRAARSSTTGVTRTGRCSSTTPTGTCSTPRCARLGAAVGQRPGPVGAEGDRGVHRHQRPAGGRLGDKGAAGQG